MLEDKATLGSPVDRHTTGEARGRQSERAAPRAMRPHYREPACAMPESLEPCLSPESRALPAAASRDQAQGWLTIVLRKGTGLDAEPRGDQVDAVAYLLEGRRVLLVQPTGWGKSMVYWAATAARRAAGLGPTVVVSPLVALMRDQVLNAQGCGLQAETIHSGNADDWPDVFDRLARDDVDVLLISPERLANEQFLAQAGTTLRQAGLVVIDEAHCISDWGFDFRPGYRRVAHVLLNMGSGTPVLATTATANARVSQDVASQLGSTTVVLRGALARASLDLSVVRGLSAVERFAWVAQALQELPGSGIVYCQTIREANQLGSFLAGLGHDVAIYTGQTDAALRVDVEQALHLNTVKAVVATSALGMGYDKPDLAFVIHVGSPDSPVKYYQQVGRAGRALKSAHGVLLPAEAEDLRLWDYFATSNLPDPDLAGRVLLNLESGPMSRSELSASTGAQQGKVDAVLKHLHADGAVEKVEGARWARTGAPWQYDQPKYDAVVRSRRAEAALMHAYVSGDRCLMQVLTEALDDPTSPACGRCSVCTGEGPLTEPAPCPEMLDRAHEFFCGLVMEVEPRKRWPAGVERRGNICGCERGRAVVDRDHPHLGRLAQECELPDGPPSRELVDETVKTVTRWHPDVTCVIAAPTPGSGLRARALAKSIAAHTGLRLLDGLTWSGSPVPPGNSAAVVKHLEAAISLSPRAAVTGETVLMVVVSDDDRWVTTVSAALLREAGAPSVVPLVIRVPPW